MASDEILEFSVDFTVSSGNVRIAFDRLERFLTYAANREGVRGELGIWLCTDDEIADLHLRFMDIPGPTDVITFPEDPPESGGYLGDVAVSVDTAKAQARDGGHSVEREIAYLCLHGLLHIAGYDDGDRSQRERMFERQERLLSEFEQSNPGEWIVRTSGFAGDNDSKRG